MQTDRMTLVLSYAVICLAGQAAVQDAWPGWRGDGSGISLETSLPTHWDAETNIAWQVELPGEGNASPIVWGDRVILTAATEKGAMRRVICLSTENGAARWDAAIPATRETATYAKAGYAAATPVTDGIRVYAFFDSPGLTALDLDSGKVVWTVDLGEFKSPYNMSCSPILYADSVIVCCDHGGDSFIAAFAVDTGQERWRTARDTGIHYSAPLLIQVGDEPQVVVNALPVIGYDPRTGAELWRCRGMKPVVVPSCVYADGLVYATSGRNGPAMAIDPTGHGDVSDTLMRFFVPAHGPYVPTPVVYPYLFLPGDNGVFSFITPTGEKVLTDRLRGHYTASPVAAAGRIYWTTERGITYVLEVSGVTEKPAVVRTLATNRLGENVLASPAIAGGRIFLRGDRHLFCIAGDRAPATAATAPPVPVLSMAEIEASYAQHQAGEGADVAIRLDLVAALAQVDAASALPLLTRIVKDDNHWDVSEEAAKTIGVFDTAAVPALIDLLEWPDWRPYPKIIAAGHLGRLRAAAAVPALVKAAGHRDQLVRIAAFDALAAIGVAHGDQVAAVLTALIGGLADDSSAACRAATLGLGLLGEGLASRPDELVARLLDLTAARSPLVADAARTVLQDALRVAPEVLARDELLYGEQRRDPYRAALQAGPVSLTFADGELRYLQVAGREIVRRVYFGVRDARWDTVMPTFSRVEIKSDAAGFRIELAADCRNDIAAFGWRATISGGADGTIVFAVDGKAGMDFHSPRIGLNVLFGAESLAGQAYELLDVQDQVVPGAFPALVSRELLAKAFKTLRYSTDDGTRVEVALAATQFGMEDQRNYCDSSYKAFSGLALSYPKVSKGAGGKQQLTIRVSATGDAAVAPPAAGPISITVGAAVAGTRFPVLQPDGDRGEPQNFMHCYKKSEAQASDDWLTMSFNPAAHMPDEDMFMENIPALVDQVRSIRALSPAARFRISPITIDSPYPRRGPDPRNHGQYAAAWSARMLKYLALAGVDEAVFKIGPGPADAILLHAAGLAGLPLLATDVAPHAPVDVLAVADTVWLINKTAVAQVVSLSHRGEVSRRELPPFAVIDVGRR